MHELSITQNMLDIVLDYAKKNKAVRVGKINLVIGALTGYVADSVQFYFDLLSKGTLAEGAVLEFTAVSARGKCRACGASFALKEFEWLCPDCQSQEIDIIAGRELFVESIEVD
jgi:hydrogenase nickel incorporation protein HypA/HybF